MTEPTFTPALDDAEPYDEFALVAENAREMGVAWPGPHMPWAPFAGYEKLPPPGACDQNCNPLTRL